MHFSNHLIFFFRAETFHFVIIFLAFVVSVCHMFTGSITQTCIFISLVLHTIERKSIIQLLFILRYLIIGCEYQEHATGKLTVLANVLGILDFILNFPGYHRWRFTDVLRNILKIIVSLAWSIILPVCYLHQNKSFSFGKVRDMLSFLDKFKGIPPLYMIAVIIYLLPNILAAVLFIFPMLRRWIENSDWVIVRFLLWWSQVWLFPFPSL